MTPSEILEKAADAIETYGHNRMDLGSEDEGMCVVGALHYARTGETKGFMAPFHDPIHSAAACLRPLVGDTFFTFFEWSDASDTQEVLDTLRKAAKDARLEEEGLTP